ncbi:hypothetical protein GL181_19220 [Vibrio toranzoniae]|nr:hypothetical protein [Vibrio toranzoniae]
MSSENSFTSWKFKPTTFDTIASNNETDSKDLGNFYAGIDAGFYNETELEYRGSAIEDSSDLSGFSYKVGGELGAILTDNIDIHLGYRNARVEIDSVDVSSQTAYIGARYHF